MKASSWNTQLIAVIVDHAIRTFLDINSDFDVFKEIDIIPNQWFGTGSLVPAYKRQIEFLESLYPLITGVKYLKHRNLIREKIESLREMIKEKKLMRSIETYICKKLGYIR